MRDFEPENVLKVSIDEVELNDYNPKLTGTKEYEKVVESLRVNGLASPIIVREVEGKYVVVDGAQRLTACRELGFEEVYVYNLGEISEEEAKSLTIWLEVQVPFNELELAPLVVELNKLDIEIPYSDEEVDDYANMLEFDFTPRDKEVNESEDDGFETLIIRMTEEQYNIVREEIDRLVEEEDMSEGEALAEICSAPLDGVL